jgi:hypothetical protein
MKNYKLFITPTSLFRTEAKQWFARQVEELGKMKLPEKLVKRTILSAIRYRITCY